MKPSSKSVSGVRGRHSAETPTILTCQYFIPKLTQVTDKISDFVQENRYSDCIKLLKKILKVLVVY